jgi:hypothetical protein
MTRKLIASLAVILIFGTGGFGADVKFGGYLSLEFDKGQADSGYSRGSLTNIMGGLTANGLIASRFGFSLEVRALSETQFEIEQAWVGFVPSQAFSIKAGMYIVPFGNWNVASRPYETLLVGTPLNLQYLYPPTWRDLGVLVSGDMGILSYAAYIGNGLKEADNLEDGQQFSDNNKNFAKGGRVALKFGQEIRAGVSYYTGKYDDLDQRNLILEGVDLSWVTPQWEVWGEATRALIENPEPYAEGKSEGYSIWTVMSFSKIQPIGSFQRVKYEDPYHGGGVSLDLSRWTAGLRWVIGQGMFLKGEYEWNNETPKINNNVVRIQAALSF